MAPTRGYAAKTAGSALEPFEFERREPGPRDVLIEITHCGVCHSDIHQARDEWGGSTFPMVPGHEIVGTVVRAGDEVTAFSAGDTAAVGVMVDSCRECQACISGEEQYCERDASWTYNGYERDGTTPTYGGYSKAITVDEAFVLRVPPELSRAGAAPLLCAGITTYSPLRHWGVKSGDEVAIVGLGGLGHMGVKLAAAFGARVSVLSHSPAKRDDALRLGAHDFVTTTEPGVFEKHARHFDLIIDTVSAAHDLNDYLGTLRRDGTLVLVGIPDATPVKPFSVIGGRKRLAGSQIGGIRETQEMLDFCAAHGIESEVEVIPMAQINEAWERTIRSDVRYRFVVDLSSL